jgi:hypothetical protein
MLASHIAQAVRGVLCGPDLAVDGAAFDSPGACPGVVRAAARRARHDFIDGLGVAPLPISRPPAAGWHCVLVDDTARH